MIHRAPVSRTTWYGHGWALHLFRWGFHYYHVAPLRPRAERRFHHYRLAFGSRSKWRPGTRLIDYSHRITRTRTTKPEAPCWRFWIAVGVGKRGGRYYDHQEARIPRAEARLARRSTVPPALRGHEAGQQHREAVSE